VLQKLRETLTLVLIGVLPFHAFLVTVLTRVIAGPGHAPIMWLALWKEALIMIILLIAAIEILRSMRKHNFQIDWIDGIVLAIGNLALVVSAVQTPSLAAFAFGAKYDLLPLASFLLLRRVPWSEIFRARAARIVLIVGGVLAIYSIDSFFLPQKFFTWLGYSPLHSLYIPDGPVAAFQQIGGTALRRVQATLSGPNQFGLWLLLPWSIALAELFAPRTETASFLDRTLHFFHRRKNERALIVTPYLLLLIAALALTFSRAAWIAAVLIGGIVLVRAFPLHVVHSVGKRAAMFGLGLILFLAILSPAVLLRLSSTRDHIRRPIQAMETMLAHPWGLGLAAAGPAANHLHDACVYLEKGSDASWARRYPGLCVFVGEKQMQPARSPCDCPLIPENWYLQIGVELGVLGFVLFLALTILLFQRLFAAYGVSSLHAATALTFLGVSIAALFLHAWEDAAVAMTVWILVAAALETRSN
jgi:hypothetical protein